MRRLGVGILTGLLLSCSALSSAAKAEDVEPCENLSRAFHHFAMNKDKGVSLQQQSEMMDLSKKDDTEIYLSGILNIIYAMPESSASEIKSAFLKVFTVNEQGKIELPPEWDPWVQSR